jgi:hypothetical protein
MVTNMFKKKKLYKIVYRILAEHSAIIEAKDEFQAIRKFNRKMDGIVHEIVSFEEYRLGQ